MADLIDRQELSDVEVLQREKECVRRKSATNCSDCLNCDLLMPDERIMTAYDNAIKALIPVDAVEVVRCKDCKHHESGVGGLCYWCSRYSQYFYGKDFCSYGERKQDG